MTVPSHVQRAHGVPAATSPASVQMEHPATLPMVLAGAPQAGEELPVTRPVR